MKTEDVQEDGVFSATLRCSTGQYQVSRIDGVWFFTDGTGWRAPVDPREITGVERIQS